MRFKTNCADFALLDSAIQQAVIKTFFLFSHAQYMKGNKSYFTEFMFSTDREKSSMYYFPVLIKAQNAELAAGIRGSIIKILQPVFNQIKFLPLRTFKDPLFSEMLRSFSEHQCTAEVYKIDLKSMRLSSLENEPINLNTQMRIVPQNLQIILRHTIHYHLERHCLLTTQFHKEVDFEKEFLILKIDE